MAIDFWCQYAFVNFYYILIFLQYFVILEYILQSLHNKKSGITVAYAPKLNKNK